MKHPWLLVSWLLLAGLVASAQKIVPQPWSAGIYPVSLFVAMLLFSRASVPKD
ncbi:MULTISPECIES: hypothetical protein [unclassified Streptomyces]|uniref:hypothetical protein n=1 Tax=unclassified Streptomyces TaxID=2593676 RepID=UPI002E0EF439|nr:hypothetical protein OG466_23755 [Streptomyces sp. NBC_01240]